MIDNEPGDTIFAYVAVTVALALVVAAVVWVLWAVSRP